jgi:hypothetical protein
MSRIIRMSLLLTVALGLAACAVRLGAGRPQAFDVVALQAPAAASAADIAARLRAANADFVLLSADRDDAWFADVATAAGLALSGPGRTSGQGLGFLSNVEMLGDTSIVLEVTGGGSVHMHDALYVIGGDRHIDLMLVRFDAPDLRAAVRTLFGYIATDVGAQAAVLLAIDAASPAIADSAAVLMRAHYTSAAECPGADLSLAAGTGIRLLYGPSARITCTGARPLADTPAGVHANVVVGR